MPSALSLSILKSAGQIPNEFVSGLHLQKDGRRALRAAKRTTMHINVSGVSKNVALVFTSNGGFLKHEMGTLTKHHVSLYTFIPFNY